MVLCPECESDLDVDTDEIEEGDVISCAECGTDFEVVAPEPLELAAITDEDEEEAPAAAGNDDNDEE